MTAAEDVDAVYARLFPKLVGFVSLYCGDRWTAEEIAQETLSRLWERSARVEIESPDAWTYRVAMNLSTSWFRRRAIERRASRNVPSDAVTDAGDDEQSRAVRDAVERLPRRQRQVILLRYFADLSIETTAEVMGCAPGTVKAHTHKALAALARSDLRDEGSAGG